MQQLESDLDVTQEKLTMPTSAPKRLRRKSAISKRRCNNWSPTLTLPRETHECQSEARGEGKSSPER